MFRHCFLSYISFCLLLINRVTCIETFYKLVGADDDATVHDENVPFLTQSLFSCGSSENCAKVAKTKGGGSFSELIDQQKVKEDMIVYQKVEAATPKADPSWSKWYPTMCSAKCGGGKQTFVRYCYSSLPCKGESSMAERHCNAESCPDILNCTYKTTTFIYGHDPTRWEPGKSWYPLLNHKPSCHRSDGRALMTGVKLEKNGTDLRYNYTCCHFKDPICNVVENLTSWDDSGDGHAYFLDRHAIDCGLAGFISAFKLEYNSKFIRYSYRCCDLLNPTWREQMQCVNSVTQFVDDNNHSIYTLTKIPIKCPAGFGLSKFKLGRREEMTKKWQFIFRCCKIAY